MLDDRFLEICSYKLHPGARERFDTLLRTGVIPLMRRQGITVIDFGPAADSPDGYYLMCAYPSLEQRTHELAAFDSGKEWLEDYQKDFMSLVASTHAVVVPATPETLRPLASRQLELPTAGMPSLAALASPAAAVAPPAALQNARFVGQADLADVLAGRRTLGSGTRGAGVTAVQQALVDMGFSLHGGADGSFGPQSSRAVRNFQVHARSAYPRVRSTGTLDSATLQALDVLAPAPGQKGQTSHVPGTAYRGTPVRVVVVKNEHRTFLFDAAGRLQAIYGNAVGKGSTPTDPGLKKVTGKLGEADSHALGQKLWGGFVFGPRIVDLSWDNGTRSGEELHGTNAPIQLGEDVSHGCVRHANPDILALFDALSLGDKVAIVESVNDPNLGVPASPPSTPPTPPSPVPVA